VPDPELEAVHRIIPAAPDWRVSTRWYGRYSRSYYDDPYACFAANTTCSKVFTREPIPYHCRPVIAHPGPVRADIHPAGDAGHGGDEDAGSDAHAHPLPGDVAGGTGDGDMGGASTLLYQDDRCAGGDEALLLADSDGVSHSTSDVAGVCDTAARSDVHEGE